jgi:hypothetical protein
METEFLRNPSRPHTCHACRAVALAALVALCCAPVLATVEAEWKPANGPLKTRWAKDVSPENVHPEYPRPQFVRKEWANLNGLWDLAITRRDSPRPTLFQNQILVPFPVESALSGVMKAVTENDRVWYRRTFRLPAQWRGQRILLHFGAVDFEAAVWVNGKEVGQHRGGYDGFSFEITDAIQRFVGNEIIVAVWDPTDAGMQPRGKQIRRPHGIWYTPTSGIWQTVWLEPVPTAYLTELKIVPDIDNSAVIFKAGTSAHLGGARVEISVREHLGNFSRIQVIPGKEGRIVLKNPKLWSPESPYLYSVTARLKLGNRTIDSVESYFGMRKISLGKDANGLTRIQINNKPYFQFGPLDQGFWPDGLYTAPTDEALRYDIEITKQLGYNTIRKHVKIEPERWYYWCDKLGLLVWQDMPSGDNYIGSRDPDITRTFESARQFEAELNALVQGRGNHPCIIMWVPYNEGWGQWDTARIAELVKKSDPSRLVNSASGWTDRGVGDVNDMHRYPGPGSPDPEPNRAGVLGEFGGLGLPLSGHTWQSERNWGYRSFTNAAALTDAYIDLAAKLFPLIRTKGLSAAIYTQTTDVEVEVNGLLTYDREVIKLDARKLAAANRGKVPAPSQLIEVVPTAQTERVPWQYTFDQPPAGWEKPEFVPPAWKQGVGGFGTRMTPGSVVRTEWSGGKIWLRREFSLKDGVKDLRLLMHHDEDAEVFLNGVLAVRAVGYTTDYQQFELSPDAKAALKPAANVLAIHCRQTAGGQYIDAGLVRLGK